MEVRWSFNAVITKAFKDENGKMHVKAIASDNLEDKHGDRMSTGAIVSMAKQANKNATPILPSHHDAFSIGKVFEAKAIHKKTRVQFFLDAVLDEDMPQSEKLFKSIKKGKKDFQLSIGGFINLDNEKAIEFEEGKNGHIIRVINDLKLDHIAVTRKDMAANPRTGFRGALIKSLETSLLELKEDGDNKKMAKKDKNVDKKDEDDKDVKNENKKDEDKKDEDINKDENNDDETSNEEKLSSVVKDMLADLTEVHKSDDGEVTEDQIKILKSIRDDITEFLKEVSPEDETDNDETDEDDNEEKDDIGEKLEALKKNMDNNTQALAKATKGAFEELGGVVKSLAKSVKAITKNKQKSSRINGDDEDDDEINKDKGNGVWNGVLFSKNAE
ncbi:MAG TPA: hypothetical protein ENI23_07890 [bacterium]|nr:hypothetical protein [bacterium]